MLNGLVGSSAIVYLTPKTNFFQLLVPSYLWAIICSGLAYLVLYNFGDDLLKNTFLYGASSSHISSNYYVHICLLGFLGSLFEINELVFLGKEKILTHNVLGLLKILTITLFLSFFFWSGAVNTDSFIQVLYIAYSIGLAASIICLFMQKEAFVFKGLLSNYKAIIKLGFQDQVANILHFLNYKTGTYALYFIYGRGDTGVFSVVSFLMEGVLLISSSISMVQYARIVNTKDPVYNQQLTLTLSKITFIILCAVCSFLSLIPSNIYSLIIGKGFMSINWYFFLLSPGIIAFGSSKAFNHYFCGIGKFYINIISNSMGLILALVGCFYVIPKWGIEGACITISITYTIVGSFLLIRFLQLTNQPLSSIILSKKELQIIRDKLKYN